MIRPNKGSLRVAVRFEIEMYPKNRIPKQDLRPKFDWEKDGDLPPRYRDASGIFAKCPKCQRITSIRICYGCKDLMCEDCLMEHQIKCLNVNIENHKGRICLYKPILCQEGYCQDCNISKTKSEVSNG